ncbi:hypothetical protein ACS0TY_030109 [Phlomoides rotata]
MTNYLEAEKGGNSSTTIMVENSFQHASSFFDKLPDPPNNIVHPSRPESLPSFHTPTLKRFISPNLAQHAELLDTVSWDSNGAASTAILINSDALSPLNALGIVQRATQAVLKSRICKHRVSIVAILEPMVTSNFNFYRQNFRFACGVWNSANTIWVFVQFGFQLNVLYDSVQLLHIHLTVDVLFEPIYMSFFYDKCSRQERVQLLDKLRETIASVDGYPWMIGVTSTSFYTSMRELAVMWIDRRRWLIMSWWTLFVWVHHLLGINENYLSIWISTWVCHHTFLDQVRMAWAVHTGGFGMLNLQLKLVDVKRQLKWWNQHVFGDLFCMVKSASDVVRVGITFFVLVWRRIFCVKKLLLDGLLRGNATLNLFFQSLVK